MKLQEKGAEKGSDTLLAQLPQEQIVIPTSQEIELSIKCDKAINTMPYAVKVFKFDKRNLEKFAPEYAQEMMSGYRDICKNNPQAQFLLTIQVKEGTKFTDEQLKFIDLVQDFEETPFHCVFEKNYTQSANDFKTQLVSARERHPNKELVPAVEVYTSFNDKKVAVMRELGITKCIITYRNYQRYEEEWKELMGLLYHSKSTNDISRFVLGVFPRMRRNNKSSLLLAPLRYGANFVAHALPWSGGKGNVYVLSNNWTYEVTQEATYPLSRIQALNKANTLTKDLKQISIQQVEALLN